VQRVEPAYPQLARQRRIEGWVELEFLVGADGTPREIEVVESNPNAIFDSAATRALQRWRFEPARRGATVEAARSRTRITFRLG
jgi:protein TonB